MGIGRVTTARAVFLDRDGVLNRNIYNPATGAYEAPHHPDDFIQVPGMTEALARLRDAGFRLCLVSNQPDYALGKASLDEIHAIHAMLEAALRESGVTLDAAYYCYHHPRGITPGYSMICQCRKPSPYFLTSARDAFQLDMAQSWMVGDRVTDIECGRAAGVKTIRVAEDHPAAKQNPEMAADYFVPDLHGAVDVIVSTAAADSWR
jgi:D-glycero-D-manno-heptose 1,7-bisphosphate phosphatase